MRPRDGLDVSEKKKIFARSGIKFVYTRNVENKTGDVLIKDN